MFPKSLKLNDSEATVFELTGKRSAEEVLANFTGHFSYLFGIPQSIKSPVGVTSTVLSLGLDQFKSFTVYGNSMIPKLLHNDSIQISSYCQLPNFKILSDALISKASVILCSGDLVPKNITFKTNKEVAFFYSTNFTETRIINNISETVVVAVDRPLAEFSFQSFPQDFHIEIVDNSNFIRFSNKNDNNETLLLIKPRLQSSDPAEIDLLFESKNSGISWNTIPIRNSIYATLDYDSEGSTCIQPSYACSPIGWTDDLANGRGACSYSESNFSCSSGSVVSIETIQSLKCFVQLTDEQTLVSIGKGTKDIVDDLQTSSFYAGSQTLFTIFVLLSILLFVVPSTYKSPSNSIQLTSFMSYAGWMRLMMMATLQRTDNIDWNLMTRSLIESSFGVCYNLGIECEKVCLSKGNCFQCIPFNVLTLVHLRCYRFPRSNNVFLLFWKTNYDENSICFKFCEKIVFRTCNFCFFPLCHREFRCIVCF